MTKIYLGLIDIDSKDISDLSNLDGCEGTMLFNKKEALEWACSEGDAIVEVEIVSVKVMKSQLKAVSAYPTTKPTKKKGAK